MKKRVIALRIATRIYAQVIYDYIKPFLSWKFLVSFFLAWFITNGWAYVIIFVGTRYHIKWMTTIGASYQGFLWLPCTPEKLVTIPIAIFFHKLLFPKDFKTLDKFNSLLAKEKKK